MPRVVRLDYIRGPGAEGCAEDSFFRDHVEAHLGRGPFSQKAAARLRVVVVRDGGLYRARWEVLDAEGLVRQRDFPPAPHRGLPDCFNVLEGLAFTYAVDVDPLGRAKKAAGSKEPAEESEEVEQGPAEKADPVPSLLARLPPAVIYPERLQRPPRPPSIWEEMDLTIGLSSYVLMTAAFTADVGPGFGVGADVRGEIVSVALELRGVLPGKVYAREVVDPSKPSRPYDFDVSSMTALLVPCARWKYVAGCAVVEGGMLILSNKTELSTIAHFTIGPRLRVEVPFLERFAVFGFGEVLFAPSPYTAEFVPDPTDPTPLTFNVEWTQSPAVAMFGAGLSVSFK